MANPICVEACPDPGTIVGDAHNDRAAARSIRHASHFCCQMVGGPLVGRPTEGNGSIGPSSASLLLEVHPLQFDVGGRLSARQSVQGLFNERVDRRPPKNAQSHVWLPSETLALQKGNYTWVPTVLLSFL